MKEAIIAALKTVYDPEIPVNLYDLGLIYRLEIGAGNAITIDMTLTTPHCPVAEQMPGLVQAAVESVPEVGPVTINLVWDPPWDRSRMSEDALLQTGLF